MTDYTYCFQYLRNFKDVTKDTEQLVTNTIRKRYNLSASELKSVFESGIQGEYGKFVVCDPQTLLNWVKGSRSNIKQTYLDGSLLDPSKKYFELGSKDWNREANKCFTAYLNGVPDHNFHPHVYDKLMLDGKIELNAYQKFYSNPEWDHQRIVSAKQKVLSLYFGSQKANGKTYIYSEAAC